MDQVTALRTHVAALAAIVRRADPATPVPTCPGWDLARLAGHVGGTHRWAAAMVSARAGTKLAYEPFGAAVPADPAALPDWLDAGVDDLVRVLADTPPDTPVWSWTGDRTVRFWRRRLVHEAAVHHADAALAVGAPVRIGLDVAADGVDEFFTNLPHAAGIAALPAGADPAELRIPVPERFGATPPLVTLYLYLWGRLTPS